VLDPFMGIGSVAYEAVLNDRNAIGFELKESYYEQSVRNVAKARQRREEEEKEKRPLLQGMA